MKRDLSLVRKILLRCEEAPANQWLEPQHFDLGVDSHVLGEHVSLMIDAGLLDGNMEGTHDDDTFFFIKKITWSGHDFLDASRDIKIWTKFLEMAKEKGLSLTFDLALAWLKKEVAAKAGIQIP
jgi:hypothetical protein